MAHHVGTASLITSALNILGFALSDMPRSEIANFVTEDFSNAQITVRHNVADSIQLNAIGLAVEDTIHLMTRFGAESRRLVDKNAEPS